MPHVSPVRKWSPWTALPLLAALLCTLHLSAQPVLVKDINTNSERGGSAPPQSLCNVNGTLFFVADDGANGPELWKSDGTATGTNLVRNIHPGSNGEGPRSLINANGTLYLVANDGARDYELWRSDGTAAGTTLVRDIETTNNYENAYDIDHLSNVNGTVFFRGQVKEAGAELWKSDGTAAGTVLVKDINPNFNYLFGYPLSSNPHSFTPFNGLVYFVANNGVSGEDLWRSDGTAAGTVRVKDVPGVLDNYGIGNLLTAGNLLYFTVWDGGNTYDLWKSNGTEAGTLKVKTFTRILSTNGSSVMAVGSTLYLAADDGSGSGTELWKSDGTGPGTVQVKDLAVGSQGSNPTRFTEYNGRLFFFTFETNASHLWSSDGTAAGTVRVTDTPFHPFDYSSERLVRVGNTLYFTARQNESGLELWRTDGTSAGTRLVRDVLPGSGSSTPAALTAMNNQLYFSAYDGEERELWKSDGTAAGTVRVKNIRPGSGSALLSKLTDVHGTLFFGWQDGSGRQALWKSDGAAERTVPVKEMGNGPYGPLDGPLPAHLTNVKGTLYFTANDATSGTELWKSDGTAAGTVQVKDIFKGTGSSSPQELADINGTLFFSARNESTPYRLWKSDGTEAGTVPVQNASSAVFANGPNNLLSVGGTVYFLANGGSWALWKSDGTSAGTVPIKSIAPGNISPPVGYYVPPLGKSYTPPLVQVNGIVYFVFNDGVSGYELWRSDGTEAGTLRVKDINPGPSGSNPYGMLGINGTLYLVADNGTGGYGLWKSNGTEAGTEPIPIPVIDPKMGGAIVDLVNVNGTLFFLAYANYPQGGYNGKIWKSDGTAAGTTLVNSPGYSWALNPVASNGLLYFQATGNSHPYSYTGTELWRSDGTEAGTMLVKDLAPGEASSSPANLTSVGSKLFFTANDGTHGVELWKYEPAACTAPIAALATTGSTVCKGAPVTVQVKGTQTGVSYQLLLRGRALGEARAGGGDLTFTLPPDLLAPAAYLLLVKASGCTEVLLTQTVFVEVLPPVALPAATGVTVAAGQAATLTASGAPAGGTYRWYGAAGGGTILATGATYTTPGLWASTTYYVSVYQNAGCESARVPVTVGINGGGQLRVNAGGGAFTTPAGKVFAADASFTGGTVSAIAGGEVAGTTSDVLYHTLRVGAGFSYALPTGNGFFDVTLHFNETYWGYRTAGGIGSRQFNVDLEGSRRLTNYDIFAQAGGAMRARTETFRVRVADGTLNIAFSKGLADNPAIAAIEAVPAGPAPRINAGGPAYVTAGGQTFVADAYFAGGNVSALPAGEVAGTTEDALYRSIRFGSSFSYNIPVSNATYGVFLHFNETYWGYRAAGGVGSRRFNVDMEGSRRLTNYDIFAAAGGAMRARVEAFTVTVTDGVLNIAFGKGLADNPSIAAIEVVPAPGGRLVTEAAPRPSAVMYPNPVRDKLYVSLDEPAAGVTGTALTDALGVVRLINGHRVQDAHTLEVDVRLLRPGAYLLTLTTAGETRLLRFIKQ